MPFSLSWADQFVHSMEARKLCEVGLCGEVRVGDEDDDFRC